MTDRQWAGTVAYCGLVCGVCVHGFRGCRGCRSGGGSENCHQRTCCTQQGLDGCWQCARFPCDEGYFADDAWKGLCIGCVQAIRETGAERFAALVRSRFGERVDYGEYRFRDPNDIAALLCDDTDAGPQHGR